MRHNNPAWLEFIWDVCEAVFAVSLTGAVIVAMFAAVASFMGLISGLPPAMWGRR